ncbi:hypothetical protein [Marixanthomonas spongiae]|uniref:Uncharacterized protein n=1 Tax=Marixanthomonas spongiae TaxID=2174845 RepID=A0A2U0I429_9FLAO|nr:hypothetical protein [Marixanthomonas spongiae]PVW15849.1 hypothetical protein DDV96_06175 [Marixanthomonas spongiae]
MKLKKSIKQKLLLIAGMLTITLAQLMTHYIDLQDGIIGILSGLGIGLLLGSFFQKKQKPTI